jgi:Salmonella virulence plasmid 65kDa B protein
MRPKRTRVVHLVALCLALIVAAPAAADPPRAPGSNTGDGSTSFTGLAQAPSASLNIGASQTSIEIEVPPGRKNVTPRVALAYSSAGGPSPYGYGWDLQLGKIQRNTKHGVPVCGASQYQNDFVLLVPGATVECTLDGSNQCNAPVEEPSLPMRVRQLGSHSLL